VPERSDSVPLGLGTGDCVGSYFRLPSVGRVGNDAPN
jgi:hypothetical protein